VLVLAPVSKKEPLGMPEPPILDLAHVYVVRGTTTIVNDLSLRVVNGQHTAILGPNGSGKSTLLKLLLRTIYPSVVLGQAGEVRLFGETEWNVWDLRTKLGFVSGEVDHHFMTGRAGRLTAEQAALTGFFSSELEPDESHVTPAMRDRAMQALDWMGMTDMAQRPLLHMSTGERRRVLLARSMVHHPVALVLDEPTAGLDLKAQDQLLRHLDRLSQVGTTLILVTHHMDEILPCIQRTVLLGAGRIRFDGSTHCALDPVRLSELFECELHVAQATSGFWRVEMR
jgi:iron complex transport system ATP-binding protein